MKALWAIYRRETLSYLSTPTAYVFVAVFLFAIGAFTFQVGRFFDSGRADLASFFTFQPWLFVVFLPALAMRLWAEESRAGTVETLLTLPAPTWALVLGKFLAAWTVAAAALALTAPLWVSVNLLGDPDNGAIFSGYLGSLLLAGAYLAIGAAMSALTSAQVVAYVGAVLIGFVLTAIGAPIVTDFFQGGLGPDGMEIFSSLSILEHFGATARGVLELRTLFFFATLIGVFLAINALAVDSRREG